MVEVAVTSSIVEGSTDVLVHGGETETVAYRHADSSSDSDLLVVLLHGMANSSRVWEPLLIDHPLPYRTLAIDVPGHGASTISRRWLTLSVVAAPIVALLRQMPESRVILVGYSLGAVVGLEVAANLGSRVEGLVLVSGPPAALLELYDSPLSLRGQGKTMRFLAGMILSGLPGVTIAIDRRRSTAGGRREILAGQVEDVASIPDDYVLAAVGDLGHGRVSATAIGGFLSRYRERFRGVTTPYLAVTGEADSVADPASVRAFLTDVIGPGEIRVLDDVGHMPMIEAPAELSRLIRAFVDDLGVRGSSVGDD